MEKKDLLKLIDDDDLGLLKVKPRQSAITPDDRLVASFKEINKFYEQNAKEPTSGGAINEHLLASRLKSIRADKEKVRSLAQFDEHGILQKEIKELKSLADVFEDDDLGILESDADNIFNLKHVSKVTTMPDYVARRKQCKDFDLFEDILKQCQKDLSSGKRILRDFKNEQQIAKDSFFVLKGILLYIAEVGEKELVNGKQNARLRCIFENGTESDMMLRSLSAELYKDGRRVTKNSDELLDDFNNINEEDEQSGYIYVLKSLSDKPAIKEIKNLYKIGFSKIPVEERIRNAETEPTYLMAPVKIVSAFQCYNLNPQKFELLLHKFFGSSCINVDVYDNDGKRFTPREWFVVPIADIERAIQLIINGDVLNYRYDSEKGIYPIS